MNAVLNRLKVPGISLWVTLYLGVVIAFGVILGVPALLGEGFAETQTIGWGGRELGIAIGAIIVGYVRSALGYMIIFVIGSFRELSDMLEALDETPANTGSAVMVGVFLAVGLVCAWLSFVEVRRQSAINNVH